MLTYINEIQCLRFVANQASIDIYFCVMNRNWRSCSYRNNESLIDAEKLQPSNRKIKLLTILSQSRRKIIWVPLINRIILYVILSIWCLRDVTMVWNKVGVVSYGNAFKSSRIRHYLRKAIIQLLYLTCFFNKSY